MPLNTFSNHKFCDANATCTPPTLPAITTGTNCKCTTLKGRINDYFFLPCSVQPTDVEVADPNFWAAQETAGTLIRYAAKGIGGISQTNEVTVDVGGCGTDVIIDKEWEATWTQHCLDYSDAELHKNFQCALAECNGAGYNAYARLCGDTDVLVSIGNFSVTSTGYTVPEDKDALIELTTTIGWRSLCAPKHVYVTGLSALVPAN